MDLGLEGKKVLISAGHKGVGAYIARRFLQEGASVAICCRRQDDLDQALEEYNAIGTAVGTLCDFSDSDAVIEWVKDSALSLGGVDICIGNASASGQHGEGPDPWNRSFDIR